MIQIFKTFHGIDIMEIDSNFLFQHNQTTCPVLNIIEKFHTHQANFISNRSANMEFLAKSISQRRNRHGFKASLDYWMSSNKTNQLSYFAKNTLTGLNHLQQIILLLLILQYKRKFACTNSIHKSFQNYNLPSLKMFKDYSLNNSSYVSFVNLTECFL